MLWKIYHKTNISPFENLTDRGNTIVTIDRDKYIEKMESFLSDQSKYQKTAVKYENFFNFITSQNKHIDENYKKLVDSSSMSEETQRNLKSVETRARILYGSCKELKKYVDGCPPFRPISSASQTPIYKLAKFLVPILEPLTTNKYTVKDSFNFITEIADQDSSNSMSSLEIDSLFTNISLEQTIEICWRIKSWTKFVR